MATFRKRGSKWHVQVRRSGYPALTRSFTHKSDAETWARKTERQIDSGDLAVDQRALKGMFLRDLLVRYRDTVTPNKRGERMERYKIATILSHKIADCPLRALNPSVVTQYRDDRMQKVSGGTVRREMSVLHHCLELARKEWGLPLHVNPVGQITMPATSKPRDRRPTKREMDKLIAGCTVKQSPYLRPAILLAVETGMRRGELITMKWHDVDLKARILHIPVTKNGYPRSIPLTRLATDILSKLPSDTDDVFPISANALRLSWEKLKKRVGIKDLRFHDLRHEAISRFFELGLTVPEVALISGHRDARMLFRYTHLRPEELVAKLG